MNLFFKSKQSLGISKGTSKSFFYRRGEEGKDLFLFVHGLYSSSTDTWGNFPELLSGDRDIESFDIYLWAYPTYIIGKVPTIPLVAEQLLTELRERFTTYKRIILVGHSLGGLVIRSAILKALEQGRANDIDNIFHIITFATPNDGSQIAQIASSLKIGNNHIEALGATSTFVTELRSDWINNVYAPKITSSNELFKRKVPLTTVVGLEDNIVSEDSAKAFFRDPPPAVVPGNHFSLKQPQDRDCISYLIVKRIAINSELDKSTSIGLEDAIKTLKKKQRQEPTIYWLTA
jgi:surfactin synthase thioesterase subunit